MADDLKSTTRWVKMRFFDSTWEGGKWAKLAVFSTLQPAHYRYEISYFVKVHLKIVAYHQKKTNWAIYNSLVKDPI